MESTDTLRAEYMARLLRRSCAPLVAGGRVAWPTNSVPLASVEGYRGETVFNMEGLHRGRTETGRIGSV